METTSSMRLDRLQIRGYRRLNGNYEFDPALTLVTGPNEAGKSTLHDAVIHALFGFSPQERRRHEGSSPKEERMPWAGDKFGLSLRGQDCEGHSVLVNWDFEKDHVQLQDADTGEPLLREQPRQREDYQVGRRLVGMTREEFEQVCCLYQEALGTVQASEELTKELQRSVESASVEDVGVERADERLSELLSSLGVHGGHYGATASGKLRGLWTAKDSSRTSSPKLKRSARSLALRQQSSMRLGQNKKGSVTACSARTVDPAGRV